MRGCPPRRCHSPVCSASQEARVEVYWQCPLQARHFSERLLEIMSHMHSLSVVHGDVRIDHFYVFGTSCKLIDLSESCSCVAQSPPAWHLILST